MHFMNSHEVENAAVRYAHHPVLGEATRFLRDFMDEVNGCSDGWAYWPKPVRACHQLFTLIESARENPNAVTIAALRKALVPIKAFATRQSFHLPVLPNNV